ncbi:MAG: exo-beta-N-acetylmuramidase NamZ domain-containing protein, partial [Bacteroidales bacterium]
GGASIPLCHRMTIGEIALWIREKHIHNCDLRVVKMENWHRSMMFNQTGLPWVIPSPNMPTLNTAIVYSGMVLFEAMNISEGRGTTIPFELFGAPFINPYKLINHLKEKNIPGCKFRIHCFIPTFNKFSGIFCNGLQIHVTDINSFRPVETAVEIIDSILKTTDNKMVKFNDPPYEYEEKLIPFDILAGDPKVRETLQKDLSLAEEKERWQSEIENFKKEFSKISLYKE